MKKSILADENRCYFCGKTVGLEIHHVLAGTANRRISDRIGAWVYLCRECHTGKHGAQYDPVKNRQLKQDAQFAFERTHTRAEWMKLIGKNYL
jgi:Zn-finger protein